MTLDRSRTSRIRVHVAVPLATALACVAPVMADGWLCDWAEYNGHYYRMTEPATWLDAEAQAVAVGGHLVAINDAAENQWLMENMIPHSPEQEWGAWIGLYQAEGSPEPDGGWGWTNGEPLAYVNWAPGEPNNHGDEFAGELYGPDSAAVGAWNDLPNDGYTHVPLPGIVELEVDGLIARWDFDELVGQTILDSSPHELDGFLGSSSDPDPADPERIDGLDGSIGALNMAGTGYAQVPHSALLQPVGSITIRALIRLWDDEHGGRIVSNLECSPSGLSGYNLDLGHAGQSHVRFEIFNEAGDEDFVAASFDFQPSVVYEIAGSWNRETQLMDVFVDGARISVDGNIVDGSRHTAIGPHRSQFRQSVHRVNLM